MGQVIVVTSGKGGVGKTTSTAAIATAFALRGYKTVAIDFDIGLRNLDLIMGCERRVVYDLINVMSGEANLQQALIKDKRCPHLYLLPASQTKDKDALCEKGIGQIIAALRETFDYIICDSPAGIEKGAVMAMYHADQAIVVTNPEVSSVRDADRMLGLLSAKSKRAEQNQSPIDEHLLLTRYQPSRVQRGDMLHIQDIMHILSVPLLGVIPESPDILEASNAGIPITHNQPSDAAQAYSDAVARLLGETRPHRFIEPKKNILKKLFSRSKAQASL